MSVEEQDIVGKRNKKRRGKSIKRFLVMLCSLVVMLGFAWLVTGIIQHKSNKTVMKATPPKPLKSGPRVETQEIDNSAWNLQGKALANPNETDLVAPDYRMLALPENGRVDESYFASTLFVGDSITQGLELYKVVPGAKFCAYKGIGPKQIYDGSLHKRKDAVTGETVEDIPIDYIVKSEPENVYILLGTNSMVGMNDESLLAYYSEMLDQLVNHLKPGTGIYVQSITPILINTPRFDIARIHSLNNALAKMANDKGVYFLDLHEALAGEDYYLRQEFGAKRDGYHLLKEGCIAWKNYLATHTAYRATNPYIEAPPYAQEALPAPPAEEPPAA